MEGLADMFVKSNINSKNLYLKRTFGKLGFLKFTNSVRHIFWRVIGGGVLRDTHVYERGYSVSKSKKEFEEP